MAVTPLDLQMLFSQLDKFAKEVHAQKEGVQLHKTMEAAVQQKLENEKSKTVHEASNNENSLTRLNEDGREERNPHEERQKNETAEEQQEHAVRDPNLGRYIDLSG
ncbi:MAG: hypothetical protein LBG79_06295 [Spirochaetaceae bacterium]|jgi:uncharacterized membrane protein (UPF0182 family)|nr:hypothetical protein [Spirochaetaceae bacterium]